ncbi:hypothetical protein [Roseomonas chloroacetimidivorans]|uniref:hypothetical protein n=1 Tax=Roseomonas chloroacetimidivorans TaxID=1766656 RepID=UPI003C740552
MMLNHHSGLIDRSPGPGRCAADLERDLIEVPLVTACGRRRRIWQAKVWPNLRLHPLVADRDARQGRHLLQHAQVQREAEVDHTARPMFSAGKQKPAELEQRWSGYQLASH